MNTCSVSEKMEVRQSHEVLCWEEQADEEELTNAENRQLAACKFVRGTVGSYKK